MNTEFPHDREAHLRQVSACRSMTPQQRLDQALRLNAVTRQLLAAGFRQRHPEWLEDQVQVAVAERVLYAGTG